MISCSLVVLNHDHVGMFVSICLVFMSIRCLIVSDVLLIEHVVQWLSLPTYCVVVFMVVKPNGTVHNPTVLMIVLNVY